MLKRIKKHFEAERTIYHLSNLSDRDLADIGVNRGSIREAVKNGR